MNAEHPRDVDPSITGQPHQATGKVPGLMGNHRGRLVTGRECQRRHQSSTVSPQPCARPERRTRPGGHARPEPSQAAPRWSASQTAVDSRTPSSIERPQCPIHSAIPSAVPETYPSKAFR